jgi:hypothetical protein
VTAVAAPAVAMTDERGPSPAGGIKVDTWLPLIYTRFTPDFLRAFAGRRVQSGYMVTPDLHPIYTGFSAGPRRRVRSQRPSMCRGCNRHEVAFDARSGRTSPPRPRINYTRSLALIYCIHSTAAACLAPLRSKPLPGRWILLQSLQSPLETISAGYFYSPYNLRWKLLQSLLQLT